MGTKKSYSEYSSDCDENTDTTDCGGMLADSNCLAGECCCSKDAVAEGTDYSGYVTAAAPAWTESYATTSDYCSYSDCKTNFPVKCPTSYSCSGKKIDKDWAAPADDQMGGCKLCCGYTKTQACNGNKVENENSAMAFAQVGKLVMYAALLVLVGIFPAILSAVGKLKGTDANGNSPLENVCGTLSIFSVGCCGVIGAGFVSAFVFMVGAYLSVACDSVKNDPDYTGTVGSCSTECAAARTHQLDAICSGGAAASGASAVVSLAVVLSVCTS